MSTSVENIRLWMNQSEPDYYLFFLKAWIPFNAWYVAEYPLLKKKDTDIIKELQDHIDSKPRRIIKNYLDATDSFEAQKFQSHFAELHYQLEKVVIKHNSNRLTFKSLSLTNNPDTFKSEKDLFDSVYKVEKTTSYFQAYIQEKGGKILLDYKPPKYDIEGLTKDTDYIRLLKKQQNKIYSLFEIIDPKKPISIIGTSKSDSIILKSKHPCQIIKDTETVAKACIKVIYALRCMLFHGEVTPNDSNKKVYENAYFLLQLIINELK